MKLRHNCAAAAACVGVFLASTAWGYVEIPYTLGKVVAESHTITLVEVKKADKERKYIVYKKLADLKGKYAGDEIKHNIGERGFHEREWKNILAWAETGQQAVMFANGEASETCIGTYWYQCYREGEWWGMTHAEPYMLRTFYGEAKALGEAVSKIVANGEAVISCLADANREQLHLRKGKVQMLRASLKRFEYDAKRDFAGYGEGGEIIEYKTDVLLAQGSDGWKFMPAPAKASAVWKIAYLDDRGWRTGKAPLGYGEDEITARKGTLIAEQGKPVLFRREVNVPAALLSQKGVVLRLSVASDNKASVFLNGEQIDDDPEQDHEFRYWNRDIELAPKQFAAGRNVFAILVTNAPGSSDLYLDAELVAETPLPKKAPAKK
jgi:hypothetical protein